MQRNNRPSTKGQSRKTDAVGNVAFLARCVKEDQLHTGMMRDLSQRFRLPQDPTAYPLTIEGITILAPISTAAILVEDKEHLQQTA